MDEEKIKEIGIKEEDFVPEDIDIKIDEPSTLDKLGETTTLEKEKPMVSYMKEFWEDEKKAAKESYYYFAVFVGILVLDIILIIGTKIKTLSIVGWTGIWFLFVLVAISLRDMYRHKDKAENIYNLLMKVEIEEVNKEQKVTFEELNEENEKDEEVKENG